MTHATQRISRRVGHEHAWSHQYGAYEVAARYMGLSSLPRRPVLWQHGLFGPWDQIEGDVLVYHAPGARGRDVFVARQDEEHFLRSQGFRRVFAVGMPIVYAQCGPVDRVSRSLLVMPKHGLSAWEWEDESVLREYADFVSDIAREFDSVTVALHAACYAHGNWGAAFRERGFDVVMGADPDDASSLYRTRDMMERHEVVTSNSWGSHIAYALAFGCRVSIDGPEPSGTPESVERDLGGGGRRDLGVMRDNATAAARATTLERFHVPANSAVGDIEYGRWLIGWGNRRDPEELRSLFRWRVLDEVAHFPRRAWSAGWRRAARMVNRMYKVGNHLTPGPARPSG